MYIKMGTEIWPKLENISKYQQLIYFSFFFVVVVVFVFVVVVFHLKIIQQAVP